MKRIMQRLVLALLLAVFAVPLDVLAARIKDIATFSGMRENQLLGYGLMVGLENSGDKSAKSPFTVQTLVSMLKRLGTTIDVRQLTGRNIGTSDTRSLRDLKVENLAAVMVTASLPPFARPGQKMDISVSSMGDAKSLAGGTLLMTPLRAADGAVYALAQGTLKKEPTGKGKKGRGKTTSGIIPSGAIIEKGVKIDFNRKVRFELLLNKPDFTTANSVVDVINAKFGKDTATGLDATAIELTVPSDFQGTSFSFISQVESLEVERDIKAKVVLDRTSGTVVVGEHVEINNVSISFADINVQIKKEGFPQSLPSSQKENGLKSKANINELVSALNALGVSPRDLVSIFRSLRASGALSAELEIL